MEGEVVTGNGVRFAVRTVGLKREDAIQVLWGHGWGQSGQAMLPLAESLGGFVSSTVIDFPGFGASPMPPETWGTAEYADAVADWLRGQPARKRYWVGHSFGGRVGIQLAARHPELLNGLVLLAAAGLKRKRSLPEQVRFVVRKNLFKAAKFIFREGPMLDRVRARMGSVDYRSAGQMRRIFTRVVNEDLTREAAAIRCPVLLVYGAGDTETPVEMGRRLEAIIGNSKLVVLDGQDHYSILGEGRHITARHILGFLKGDA